MDDFLTIVNSDDEHKPFLKNYPFTAENFDLEKSLARNKAWIESKMKEGYEIFDIGPKGETITSPFYKLEREIIKLYNYPTKPIVK